MVKKNLRRISFKKRKHEDEFNKWAHVKMDPVKNEVNTENIKTEEKIKHKKIQ